MIQWQTIKGCEREEYPHGPGEETGRLVKALAGKGRRRPGAAGRKCFAVTPTLPGRVSPPRGKFRWNHGRKFALSRTAQGVFICEEAA